MQLRDAAARDPVLLAPDDIGVAVLVCARRHLGRRRSGFRLGDANRGLVAGKNEVGSQPLLLFGAVLHDRGDGAHVGFDRNAPRRPAYPRHFLDDQRGLEVTSSATAMGCRNRVAHEARGLQRGHVVERIGFGSIDLRRLRREFGFGQSRAALRSFSCSATVSYPLQSSSGSGAVFSIIRLRSAAKRNRIIYAPDFTIMSSAPGDLRDVQFENPACRSLRS